MCFGCGVANPDGLHIRSFLKNSAESQGGGEVVAEWKPEKKYEAFEGVLNGGIIGTLLDCHCNWTAAYHLMKRAGENRPPCTVTAEYAIKLLRPTPTNDSVFLAAKVVEITDDRATIEGTLSAGGKVCATCFNPDGGDNSSVTASERSISSTRFYVDPFEHRHLR